MKILTVLLCMLLLCGCTADVFETVGDGDHVAAVNQQSQLILELPADAAAQTMVGTSGILYFCEDYEIMVETLISGDMQRTVKTITGFDMEELALVRTTRSGVPCVEGAWSAAGEGGDQVGRFVILDDGAYHYCISVMTEAEKVSQCADSWQKLLSTAKLAET